MSCEENDSTGSLLSPVSSPVPQVKQHAAGNLTGELRKVKDLAADFHNLLMKWDALNSQGMEIVVKIANIKIEKVFNLQDADNEGQHTKLPLELNPLCDLLNGVVDEMSKVEAKLQYKANLAKNLTSLQQFQKTDVDNSVLFSTMSLEDVATTVKEIHASYQKELNFKQELCKQMAHAEDRNVMMFYSTSWMHQPYIQPQYHDLLQALLKETGHVK